MLSLLFAVPLVVATQRQVNDQKFVDYINAQPGILWKAGVFLHIHTRALPPPPHTLSHRTHSLSQPPNPSIRKSLWTFGLLTSKQNNLKSLVFPAHRTGFNSRFNNQPLSSLRDLAGVKPSSWDSVKSRPRAQSKIRDEVRMAFQI